ncbi:hypothetical protein SAMN02745136_00511 [Anaerocolumna jejuensis DSM 15929]|uniref:Uncharacterized protein n=1 Tax=Anaerocolumna jejuensis DSM 15929 TaxID=1121322 RepID=A0A1M6KMQ9_9FIRM|nr:hypothetical protein [Anaerocolumna jejuensis]SHJ60249.1 hypothetical protein SAMN02745136_00511 [Anaerocolumna jejuensis DSM 15929]
MRLLCFGYIKICDKETGKVLLGKPVAFSYQYFEVDLTKVVKGIGLGNIIVKLDKRALKKLKGDCLVLVDGNREARVSLAGVDTTKPLVLTDLEQYFKATEEKEDISQCINHEMTFLFDELWLLENQEKFTDMLAGRA